MDLTHIFFHDSEIIRVIEDTRTDDLFMEIEYPTNWEESIFEPRRLVFRDVLEYEVHEGPFYGRPTILDVNEVEQKGERPVLQIETTAGFRQLLCSMVELLPLVETV
jgi:hypothetical protein